jgi:hypothetical protein
MERKSYCRLLAIERIGGLRETATRDVATAAVRKGLSPQ